MRGSGEKPIAGFRDDDVVEAGSSPPATTSGGRAGGGDGWANFANARLPPLEQPRNFRLVAQLQRGTFAKELNPSNPEVRFGACH